MPNGSSDCDGVVDVGVLVIAHCDNPARTESTDFLRSVLLQERRCIIPITAFIGAYHILTTYLKIPKADVAASLLRTLSVPSDAFYEHCRREDAKAALLYATSWNVQSWDGYLVSLAIRFGTRTIFSIDTDLHNRAEGFSVTNPIPPEKMSQYHAFVQSRRK